MTQAVEIRWNAYLESLAIKGPATWEQVRKGFESIAAEKITVFNPEQIVTEMDAIADMKETLERLLSSGGFMLEGAVREGEVPAFGVPDDVKGHREEWMITHSKAKPLTRFLGSQSIQTQPGADVFFFNPHDDQYLSYYLTTGGSVSGFCLNKPDGNVYDLGVSSLALARIIGNRIRGAYSDKGITRPYVPASSAGTLLLIGQCKAPGRRN